ncbi:hypothetical protein C479_14343 [Halovivax asiaticus JCM 14624]|uniref:Uncharacterized protein n=1 Tax=Halovivax asiaticus JCM 14624 TaxID=1227490 RepID=M0BCA6_9EURY|nr:hypothetical protein [Halovivax asiaticus]ELZ08526.1 hypothetical protein C479_14343 [Halovivax asiaticus JCM 14624]
MAEDRSTPTDTADPGIFDPAHLRYLTKAATRWIAVGAGIGAVSSVGLLLVTTPKGATDTSFALGALLLGFGVMAWSMAVGLGETINGVRRHLGGDSGWTERGAREAFFVLSWTGAGWVLTAALTSIALGVG